MDSNNKRGTKVLSMLVLSTLKHALKFDTYLAMFTNEHAMKLSKYITYMATVNIDFFSYE